MASSPSIPLTHWRVGSAQRDERARDPHRRGGAERRILGGAEPASALAKYAAAGCGALWPVQARAICNLEELLALAKPRALIQMATGSGKTFTACNLVYRLIKYDGARRVLFLVDRNNLGVQTKTEFDGFQPPGENRKFSDLYNVRLMDSGHIVVADRVCISTIKRAYSVLGGEDLDPEKEELSSFDFARVNPQPGAVEYNPDIPIHTFDFIITDECHRSIYNLWRQVPEISTPSSSVLRRRHRRRPSGSSSRTW